MIPEFVSIAREVYHGADIRELDHSIIGKEKSTTNKRQLIELRLRLNTLTERQIELLSTGSLDEEKQITHLALSKAYQFYKDFVIETIREKYQVYDFILTELDYNTFVSSKKIKELNKQYRDKNEATDVLSFPIDEEILGDIIISAERAAAQAQEYGHSLKRELAYLTVHGILHLFGYDHHNKEGKSEMRQKEERVLTQLNISRD